MPLHDNKKNMIGQAILEGVLAGLILSVFVGPIFFTMLQLGVEHGFKAALALALGQWASDFMYIFLAFWSAAWVEELMADTEQQATFIWYSGTFGGFLLIIFGAALMLTQSVSTKGSDKIEVPKKKISHKAYLAYFTQGYLINTVNPTPLLFWMGLMAAAIARNYTTGATAALFTSVMIIVIVTDSLKIALAKAIKKKLKPHHILYVRRLAGVVLAGFGLVLLVRVNIWS